MMQAGTSLSRGIKSGLRRFECCPQRLMPWTRLSRVRAQIGTGTPGPKPVAPPALFPYNKVRTCFLTMRVSMAKTRITTKGQVTIPRVVRERLGLRPGDELEFVEEDGVFRLRKRVDPEVFKKYRGYLKEWVGQDSDGLVRQMRGQ